MSDVHHYLFRPDNERIHRHIRVTIAEVMVRTEPQVMFSHSDIQFLGLRKGDMVECLDYGYVRAVTRI